MKNLYKYCLILAGSVTLTHAADAAVQNLTYGGGNSNYAVEKQAPVYPAPIKKQSSNNNQDDKFYVGARFDLTLTTFKNEYSFAVAPDTGSDSYVFNKQMGFDIYGGYQIDPQWRVELNYADTGKLTDKDTGHSFEMSAKYILVNGIYTIQNWNTTEFYVGGGLGAGIINTSFTGIGFAPDAQNDKSSVGIAGQLLIGLNEKLSEKISLDITYKLSGLTGHTHELTVLGGGDTFKSKTGFVLNNTVGLGLRYTF